MNCSSWVEPIAEKEYCVPNALGTEYSFSALNLVAWVHKVGVSTEKLSLNKQWNHWNHKTQCYLWSLLQQLILLYYADNLKCFKKTKKIIKVKTGCQLVWWFGFQSVENILWAKWFIQIYPNILQYENSRLYLSNHV